MKTDNFDSQEVILIRQEIQELKDRINLMEATLDIRKMRKSQHISEDSDNPDDDFEFSLTPKSGNSIEFKVGEYGMAWLGNIVLLFGFSFLVQYLQNSGYPFISVLTGFIAVAGIYAGCYLTRTSYSYLSKLFAFNGHLLLFYMAIRLHFVQSDPVIQNEALGLFILIVTLAVLFYLSYRRNSQLMAGMVLVMILISGTITNSTQIISAMTCIAAILTVFLYYRYGWLKLVFIFIFLIYLSHLNWLLNNPIIGASPGFIKSPGAAYLYFIASGFIFSSLALLSKKELVSNDFLITTIVWNGLGFSFLLAIISFIYLSSNYVSVFGVIAILCLAYAIILQNYSFLKITASMYAMYGFMAMSVTFYGILLLPKAFMLLSIQSLLVVIMALWFRSRFIVTINTILFLSLLIFYLVGKSSLISTDFSFMLVAFITARIINWKKERLNIKTEFIRNIYLISGFIMTLFALLHSFPASYVTVSWIIAALLFFILSRILNNIKYRWLAIATLVASAIRLILVDMSNVDFGFRVLVFLFLAIISITVSVLYTKNLRKK